MKFTIFYLLLIFCFASNAALLKQSTARNLMVFMTDSTDNTSGKAGLTLTITASKDGAAFAGISPSVTDRGSGWYSLALTTSHTDTLGDFAIHITGTGADATDQGHHVVADLPGATVSSVTGSVGSVTGAVGSVTGAVGSVTGAVGSVTGNVGGSVASVTAGVTVTTNNDKTGYTASTVSDKTGYTVSTVSDKTGYSLSSGGVQAVWDALTSALTTTGSIGKLLVTDVDAAISSRLATGGYTAPDNASITAIKAKTDNLPSSPAATGDAMALTSGERTSTAAVIWNSLTSGMGTAGSMGLLLKTDVDGTISSRNSTSHFDTILGTPISSVSTDIAAIKSQTNGISAIPTTDNATNVGAIKTQTDKFLFDGSSYVKAATQTNADKTGYSLVASSVPIKKNTAFPNFQFPMHNSSGTLTTGLTISCQRSIDGGAFASCANSVSEISNGYYKVNFVAADLNGDVIIVRFYGTGAKEKSITLVTQ